MLDQIETVIVGKRDLLRLVLAAVFADGHVLLEDVPGVAKTATARAIAQCCGLEFSRVQFTPDLIPADITGATVFDPSNSSIEFRPGPVFANLVLGDEINRAPPKTQSALLEAMEERQVTVDGHTRKLPSPFLVIGTQNPIESEGTYPLPEAQLDRFLIRTGIGYPKHDDEVDLVLRRAHRGTDVVVIDPLLSPEETRSVQRAVEQVHVSEPVAHYIVDIVDGTRQNPRTEAGASPRGSLALLKMARAWAAMGGRRYVLPDDVKAMAVSTLSHRLLLMPDQWVRGVQPFEVITEVVEMIPAPPPIDPGEDVGPVPQPLNFGDVQ
jgi:MoxR-like ATPase